MSKEGEIDLTDWFREAHQFDNYDDGMAYLIEKHGGEINQHGVFRESDVVELAHIGRSRAEGRLAQNAHGVWLTGISADYAIGARGDPVSVWSLVGYDTRENALDACRAKCAEYFRLVAEDRGSCCTEAMKEEARKMVNALSPKESPPQMTLFDLLSPQPVSSKSQPGFSR